MECALRRKYFWPQIFFLLFSAKALLAFAGVGMWPRIYCCGRWLAGAGRRIAAEVNE
jgi:hypothetical protein